MFQQQTFVATSINLFKIYDYLMYRGLYPSHIDKTWTGEHKTET